MSGAQIEIRCRCGQLIPERSIAGRHRFADKDLMGVRSLDEETLRDPEAAARRDMTPEERQLRDALWTQMYGERAPRRYVTLRFRCPRCRRRDERTVPDDAPRRPPAVEGLGESETP